MTIQQLQYVMEISRTGSVSKAAKTLFLSQPNLSNAIKNLENELGITIFERTPMGMQLTASGMKLAKKAASIMADIQEITSGISEEEDCLFRLVYPRYVPAFEAFWDLCTEYQEMAHLHFSCYIGDGEKQVEALYRNLCDLVIYLDTGSSGFARLCSDLHVKFVKLKDACFYVQLAEDHPLLQKPEFKIEELKNYPYVAFSDLYERDANWMPWQDIVNPNRLICVQSTSSRVSLVSNSQAFSIVLPHSEEYSRLHHVVSIPFDSRQLELGYLYSTDRGLSNFAKEYLEYFKERISFL